jgi:hypothetical protein
MKIPLSLPSRCAVVALAVAFLGIASMRADTIQTFTTTDTLANLASGGGTLTIGDLTFGDFSFFNSGLTSFDPSQIHVTATFSNGTYYLTWDGNMSFTSSNGPATADLELKYSVTAATGLIDAIDASFTGSAQPENGSFIALDESARDGNGVVVGTTHLDTTHRNSTFPIVPPQSKLYVTKDFGLAISSANGGFVSISEVAQSFHPIPEPSTTALLGVVGLGALYTGLRRSSRSRHRR